MDCSNLIFLVVAAGRGQRAGAGIPKQYRRIAGKTVLGRTFRALLDACPEAPIQTVIHPDDRALYDAAVSESGVAGSLLPPVPGGDTRQASVLAGLESASCSNKNIVLIHDAARCFASTDLIARIAGSAATFGAAVPVLPVTDALKNISGGKVRGDVDRAELASVQTPQGFLLASILEAHRKAAEAGRTDFHDDAAVALWAGMPVHTIIGDPANIKLTTPEDFTLAELRQLAGLADIRTGTGFDVHAFGPGDRVWLGGIEIVHDQGLTGHSDADVALHALTDALLGAIGAGDIGAHFPPNDPKWRGAASDIFLREAARLVAGRRGMIAHVDLTIICEAPKIGPHREAMRKRIAEILEISEDRVSLKATTTEKLGFTGRREGIAAQAAATVRLPAGDDL